MGMTTVIPTKPVPAIKADDYYLLSPTGEPIKVPAALYDAMKKYLGAKSYFAQITVTIKSGGIAGVEGTEKHIYK